VLHHVREEWVEGRKEGRGDTNQSEFVFFVFVAVGESRLSTLVIIHHSSQSRSWWRPWILWSLNCNWQVHIKLVTFISAGLHDETVHKNFKGVLSDMWLFAVLAGDELNTHWGPVEGDSSGEYFTTLLKENGVTLFEYHPKGSVLCVVTLHDVRLFDTNKGKRNNKEICSLFMRNESDKLSIPRNNFTCFACEWSTICLLQSARYISCHLDTLPRRIWPKRNRKRDTNLKKRRSKRSRRYRHKEV
jgi:hypothetical protein